MDSYPFPAMMQDSLVMILWLLPTYLAVTTVPGVSLEWVRRLCCSY